MLRPRYAWRITGSALVSALAIALALAADSPAGAQGPDVQITQLECIDDPELVVIENFGDTAQILAGWELQSEPPGTQSFDLSVIGDQGLVAGATIAIVSGPAATSPIFTWSSEEIFRDDDPTDYARIVNNTGAIVHQVNCAVATPSPTPSPEPTPAAEVPNGGGAPPVSGGSPSPVMILLVGGSLAVAGLVLISLPRLRLRPSLAVAAPSPQGEVRGAREIRREPPAAALGLALAVLCAALALILLRHRA